MDCRTLFASTSQGKTSTSTGAGSFPEWECCPRPGKVQDGDCSNDVQHAHGFLPLRHARGKYSFTRLYGFSI